MDPRQRLLAVVLFLQLGTCAWSEEPAAKWGSIRGRITVQGTIPPRNVLIKSGDRSVKDAAICAAHDMLDPTLVIDANSKGLANVAVYVRTVKAIHPSLEKPSSREVEMQIKGCAYEPHFLFVRAGQDVRIRIRDGTGHNPHVMAVNQQFCHVISPLDPAGEVHSIKQPEKRPIRVVCDIHPWMDAWWLALDHPYAAITGTDGAFAIKQLPEGMHEFLVWHERTGFLKSPAGTTSFQRQIKADETAQVDVTIPIEDLIQQNKSQEPASSAGSKPAK
jgi:plastocyanin